MSSPSRAARQNNALHETAPAKVNLTLCVLGRRRDGYHNIESLVAFAQTCDRLTFIPGGALKLEVHGPKGRAAGPLAKNLVLKAARLLAAEIEGLTLGRFTLTKNLPVAAGLGGGSADAAAALRLLARANHLRRSDARILKVARRIGADVPVCLDPRARLMRGIGEILSGPAHISKLPIVLVNSGAALATKDVFARYDWQVSRGQAKKRRGRTAAVPQKSATLVKWFAARGNDLEPAAISLAPAIAATLDVLRKVSGCRLARMSGSGATCFGLFASSRAAASAARKIKAAHPRWWVRASVLNVSCEQVRV